MSDGGSSGLSGTFELVGQATQGVQKVAQGVGALGTTAVKQVTGTGGAPSPNMSGSFDLKPGVGGGDLFSPDVQQPGNNAQQMFGNTKPLTQAGQKAVSEDRVYTQEELEKIQAIEAELKSMHRQNNDIEADIEKARREREEKYQQRMQEQSEKVQAKQMEDMQQGGQGQNVATFQAQRGTELAKGNQG